METPRHAEEYRPLGASAADQRFRRSDSWCAPARVSRHSWGKDRRQAGLLRQQTPPSSPEDAAARDRSPEYPEGSRSRDRGGCSSLFRRSAPATAKSVRFLPARKRDLGNKGPFRAPVLQGHAFLPPPGRVLPNGLSRWFPALQTGRSPAQQCDLDLNANGFGAARESWRDGIPDASESLCRQPYGLDSLLLSRESRVGSYRSDPG
jgi:hypothetical protein